MIENILTRFKTMNENTLKMTINNYFDSYFQVRVYDWHEDHKKDLAINYLLACEVLYSKKSA